MAMLTGLQQSTLPLGSVSVATGSLFPPVADPFFRQKLRLYLTVYLRELKINPLRTKMVTSGTLQAGQEYLATVLSGTKNTSGGFLTDRVFKMSLYGIFVQAPLSHLLVSLLQKIFLRHTSRSAKLLQMFFNTLTVVPIQTLTLLVCQTIVNGDYTLAQMKAAVKARFKSMYRVSSISSTLSMLFAQNFLSPELWVPFFNTVGFCLGTLFNFTAKRKALLKEKGN